MGDDDGWIEGSVLGCREGTAEGAKLSEGATEGVTLVVGRVDGLCDGLGLKLSRDRCNIRLGDPVRKLFNVPLTARDKSSDDTAANPEYPSCRIVATAPATNGAACDVPDLVSVAVSDADPADTMLTPGAHRSTHVP